MDVRRINDALLKGRIDLPGLFPHLEQLARAPHVFSVSFGLDTLPVSGGVLLIRGARQYGKSTWLEARLRETATAYGPGTGLYLNGDEIRDADDLLRSIRETVTLFRADASVRRLFIDEITAVAQWPRALKRLIDAGEMRDVLVVTTGSKATDLRRGAERLPGRKGRLDRTSYLFTPVSFSEFRRRCGDALGSETLPAYLLSGGCPIACGEIGATGRLPEHVVESVRDWVSGECARSGRSRASLLAVMDALARRGGTPIGQARLAREAGLANNTVAAGYVDLLADLLVVGVSHPWDPGRRVRLTRKPAKYPFVNLLAAVAWDPSRPRAVADFRGWSPDRQGIWLEWLVAQELWRRAAIRGDEFPEMIPHWSGRDHEIDFMVSETDFVEVKRGAASPLEYTWFSRSFPKARLTVISRDEFETAGVRGITMERFLSEEEGG